ncbi:unnamed protein product [Amoebophrya sp. A120]|nr:unnamed protein product [Amoebophrya sp. A120]|eukprot:GSA120T00003503001.1
MSLVLNCDCEKHVIKKSFDIEASNYLTFEQLLKNFGLDFTQSSENFNADFETFTVNKRLKKQKPKQTDQRVAIFIFITIFFSAGSFLGEVELLSATSFFSGFFATDGFY